MSVAYIGQRDHLISGISGSRGISEESDALFDSIKDIQHD